MAMKSGEMPHLQFCLRLTQHGAAHMVGGLLVGLNAAVRGMDECAGYIMRPLCSKASTCVLEAALQMLHTLSKLSEDLQITKAYVMCKNMPLTAARF